MQLRSKANLEDEVREWSEWQRRYQKQVDVSTFEFSSYNRLVTVVRYRGQLMTKVGSTAHMLCLVACGC